MKRSLLLILTFVSLQSFAQTSKQNWKASQRMLRKADKALAADQVDKAYMMYTDILARNPYFPPAYHAKIAIEYKTERWHEAIHTAKEYVSHYPTHAEAYVYLGVVQHGIMDSSYNDNFRKALTIYDEQIANDVLVKHDEQARFKRTIVENIMKMQPAYTIHISQTFTRNGKVVHKADVELHGAGTPKEYADRYMNYHGLQYF